MNFVDFQQQATRTNPDLGSKLNVCHHSIGMITEIKELQKAIDPNKLDIVNAHEELGDYLWYLSQFSECVSVNFDSLSLIFTDQVLLIDIKDVRDVFDNILDQQIKILDICKAYVAYNKPINDLILRDLIQKACLNLGQLCKLFNIDVFKSTESVIKKLRVRYPEKFSEENALNRDLDAELKVLTDETTTDNPNTTTIPF